MMLGRRVAGFGDIKLDFGHVSATPSGETNLTPERLLSNVAYALGFLHHRLLVCMNPCCNRRTLPSTSTMAIRRWFMIRISC